MAGEESCWGKGWDGFSNVQSSWISDSGGSRNKLQDLCKLLLVFASNMYTVVSDNRFATILYNVIYTIAATGTSGRVCTAIWANCFP